MSLIKGVGRTIGREMRALANENYTHNALTAWGPTINIIRDPRWGRNQETCSEDPFLCGSYGAAFATGMQNAVEEPRFLQVAATLKHVTGYSLEQYVDKNNRTWSRQNFSADISKSDLGWTYFPAFRQAIQKGQCMYSIYSIY